MKSPTAIKLASPFTAALAKKLEKAAKDVAANSYSPYSKFRVGAALLATKGKEQQIFTGTNVENSSYGLTICAERSAACKAVSEGYTSFIALCLFTETTEPCYPCGACCQFLAEFAPALPLLICTKTEVRERLGLDQLFTRAFHLHTHRPLV